MLLGGNRGVKVSSAQCGWLQLTFRPAYGVDLYRFLKPQTKRHQIAQQQKNDKFWSTANQHLHTTAPAYTSWTCWRQTKSRSVKSQTWQLGLW